MIRDSGLLIWATLYIGHFAGGNWLKSYKNELHALLNCRHLNFASFGVLNTVSTIYIAGKLLHVLILWFCYTDRSWVMYDWPWVNCFVVMGHKQWPIACSGSRCRYLCGRSTSCCVSHWPSQWSRAIFPPPPSQIFQPNRELEIYNYTSGTVPSSAPRAN